jgi:chromosome segregation ATPase
VVEKLSMRETEVREKERQMRAMAGELNMNQTQVSEYKKEINRLHHDLHELKDKFFELKKKEATMKERELQWLAESGMMELDRVYHEEARMVQTMTPHRRAMQKPIRYVGGGFRAIPHLDTPSKDEDVNVFR